MSAWMATHAVIEYRVQIQHLQYMLKFVVRREITRKIRVSVSAEKSTPDHHRSHEQNVLTYQAQSHSFDQLCNQKLVKEATQDFLMKIDRFHFLNFLGCVGMSSSFLALTCRYVLSSC